MDFVIIALLAMLVFFAIRRIIIDKKNHKGCCGCSCSDCCGCTSCTAPAEPEEKEEISPGDCKNI